MAARADARRGISVVALLSTPAALLCGPVPLIAWIGLMAAVLACDLWALASALRATRRMVRGLPPVRMGIDYGVGSNVWWWTQAADVPYRECERKQLVAMGSPSAAATVLSGNVLFHSGCLALVGLLSLAFGTTWAPGHDCVRTARTAAYAVRSASIVHMNSPAARCPTIALLKAERLLESDFRARDDWGNQFEVTCGRDDIVVRTDGPDHKPGTQDDIVVPPP